MQLIISEKSIAGERIAEILADGKISAKREAGAQFFQFSKDKQEIELIPLRGHITELEFPKKYANWYGTDLKELAMAEIIYTPSEPQIASLLREKAKLADKVIIATDADREGESIGLEAIRYLKEGNPKIREERAYFSAITPKEINESFSKLQKVDYNLADSADARREVDLIWGAVLKILEPDERKDWKRIPLSRKSPNSDSRACCGQGKGKERLQSNSILGIEGNP